MNAQEKIKKIDSIVSEYKSKISDLRKKQFGVVERLLDKTDSKKIARIKEEIKNL